MTIVNGLHVWKCSLISDLFDQACKENPLHRRILEAIQEKRSLKEITVAECPEQEGQVLYRGKQCVPECN